MQYKVLKIFQNNILLDRYTSINQHITREQYRKSTHRNGTVKTKTFRLQERESPYMGTKQERKKKESNHTIAL